MILFSGKALWHSNEFSHFIWPNNLHDIPSILFVVFLALKLVRFQTSKQPIKFTFKPVWSQNDSLRENRTARFGLTSSTKANRSIGHVHWNIKLNIYPSQRRNRDLPNNISVLNHKVKQNIQVKSVTRGNMLFLSSPAKRNPNWPLLHQVCCVWDCLWQSDLLFFKCNSDGVKRKRSGFPRAFCHHHKKHF